MDRALVIIAHRGDSANHPENTLPAFDAAVKEGFPHFETDCQLTADGAVIVLHDEQLGRTTPGAAGAVADASWEQLSPLDAGSWFDSRFAGTRIPLLRDLLHRYRSIAHVHLELKSRQPELPDRVAAELAAARWLAAPTAPAAAEAGNCALDSTAEARGQQGQQQSRDHTEGQAGGPQEEQQRVSRPGDREQAAAGCGCAATLPATARDANDSAGPRSLQPQPHPHPHFAVPGLTITSFHLEQLRRSRQLLPGVTHGWLIQELTRQRVEEALAAGLQQLCPRANALAPADVRLALDAGLSVRAWGVKNMQLLYRVVGCGCHGATVNWPREAREALRADTAATTAAAAAAAAAAEAAGEAASAAAAAGAVAVVTA